LLGCNANTRSPASSSRSTTTRSDRSIATNTTFKRTSVRHNPRQPLLVVRERRRQHPLAGVVGDEHVVLV
jgi:hypothetical protein